MFTRHIKKFNNAEEIQAAIEAGTLASPYIALDASSNTINLVYPQGQTIPDIDEEEEGGSAVPITMDGAILRTYKGMHGWLQTQLSFPVVFNNAGDYTPRVIVVRKSNYDNGLSQVQAGTTEADYIASLFLNNGEEGPVHPEYWWFAESLYSGDYPWGEPVTWISTKNWWGSNSYIPVPVTPSQNEDDDTYLILAAFCGSDGHTTSGNAYKIGSYKLTPGMTNSSAVVWEGIQEYAVNCQWVEGEDHKMTFSIRVPANTVYDSVKYVGYWEDEYSGADAIALNTARTASVGASNDFYMEDLTPWDFTNTSDHTKTAMFAVKLYNSSTGAQSNILTPAIAYVDPS